MRTTKVMTAVALAAAGCGTVWWLTPSASPQASPTSLASTGVNAPVKRGEAAVLPPGHPFAAPSEAARSSLPTLGALQEQIDILRNDLAQLRRLAEAPGAKSQEAVAQERRQRADDPEVRAEARRAAEQLAAARDTAFRAERIDARWAGAMSAELRQAFAAAAGAGTGAVAVRSLDCRSTSCRVEVAANDEPNLGELLAALSAKLPNGIGSVTADPPSVEGGNAVTGAGTGAGTVLYLSR